MMVPMIMMIREVMAVSVMQLPMERERSSFLRAPKYWATMMLVPVEMPMKKTSIRFRMGPDVPTAASALSPTNRPTMIESTVL